MHIFTSVLYAISILVAILFSFVVFITGKGDAMSGGGGGVRTTFKGKASFDDAMARITLIMGVSFMGLMLILDVLSNYQPK